MFFARSIQGTPGLLFVKVKNIMKNLFISAVAVIAFHFTAIPGNATVIDFEEITAPYSGNSLNSKGYNFFNDCGTPSLCILHRDIGDPKNADVDGETLAHSYSRTTTTLTRIDGNAFDLTSIDFADFINFYVPQNIQLVGTYDLGGTISQVISLSPILGFETFIFNWQGLIQVTWVEITGNMLQLDNVVVNASAQQQGQGQGQGQGQQTAVDISAPPSFILLMLGLSGLLLMRIFRKNNKIP
ncbi:hypothetical protein MNBD_ALPHA01-1523 [hydrothermal vent metagenome]|uniref:PEP-CTERM protein-sorting domain-containing protein n=1 Tax=hydrothermal vent metagenome TaxID=652676 RepID=A0A3B0SPB4_9ZZZZ